LFYLALTVLCLGKFYIILSYKRKIVCLAIPGKVVEIDKNKEHATIDYGDGTKRRANVTLVEVKRGDYVIVHAGFAIEVLNEKEAKETIALFREMLSAAGEGA
jgi:hydrogenase expression/formation protein HypC